MMVKTLVNSSLHQVNFDTTWQLLGPFQIGTREAAWGSDPLESHGGFHSLQYDSNVCFKSSLAANGTVSWSLKAQPEPQGSSISMHFDFPDVAWSSLQAVYGWPSLQWQGWARSYFHVLGDEPQVFILHLSGVLEYWLDDQHTWGGDYYGLMLCPKVLHLRPGQHQIDLRLIRDIRVMGASPKPGIDVGVHLIPVDRNVRLLSSSILLPDVVSGRFVSALGSVTLTNVHETPVKIQRFESINDAIGAHLLSPAPVIIQPGQSRPVAFRLSLYDESLTRFSANVHYSTDESPYRFVTFGQPLVARRRLEPQKFTYLHPGNIVSYAVLRPPPLENTEPGASHRHLPVLLFLHGSGITADDDAVVNSLNSTRGLDAWTVFASGVTAWCGDDWHNWGWRDVEAAVNAIPGWITHMDWRGPDIDITRWLVTGHSNGGQGVWYALGHHPDRLIAAAPAAGYTSLQAYVPYSLWKEVEPARNSLLQSALSSYKLELLVPGNAAGVPVAIQHGSSDDNVPVQHSRRMFQLLNSSNGDICYNEVKGAGHVFEGMMETAFLTQFFTKWLANPKDVQKTPRFSVVTANPTDTGPKFGIHIEQLIVPGRLGKIEAEVKDDFLKLWTSNVRRISINQKQWQTRLELDDQDLGHVSQGTTGGVSGFTFETSSKTWQVATVQNKSSHLGGLDAILRTQHTFAVIIDSGGLGDLGLQISNNLLAYFGADSVIISSSDKYHPDGNSIKVSTGLSLTAASKGRGPVKVESGSIQITREGRDALRYSARNYGLGAIFLSPGERERLEMVVWGTDRASLDVAARLVPMMTGTGQPDFIVVDQSVRWRGVDGVLAMGFFDGRWQIGEGASFFS